MCAPGVVPGPGGSVPLCGGYPEAGGGILPMLCCDWMLEPWSSESEVVENKGKEWYIHVISMLATGTLFHLLIQWIAVPFKN